MMFAFMAVSVAGVMGVIAWIGLEGRQQSRGEAAVPFGLIDLRELHQWRPAAASGAR
jgi:hypothetical protein